MCKQNPSAHSSLCCLAPGQWPRPCIPEAQVGLWQVAAVWGFGVTLAIYVTGAVSGAHLNPAVSLAFAIFRNDQFPVNRLFAYWCAQLLGAVIAGIAVLISFNPFIDQYETENDIRSRRDRQPKISDGVRRVTFPNPGHV